MLTVKALIYVEAEVREELKGLRKLYECFQRRVLSDEVSARCELSDEFVLRGIVGMHEDYYRGAERIFKRIALEVDERLPRGESRHKALLDQMKVEIPGIRSAVISQHTYDMLDELRSFRREVEDTYIFNLTPDRILVHVLSLPELHYSFQGDIEMFFERMKQKIQKESECFHNPNYAIIESFERCL